MPSRSAVVIAGVVMAEGTTAIDTALSTDGDADGSELITYLVGERVPYAEPLGVFGALQYIDSHDEIAARKLAPPFWGKPFIAALLSSFLREIQRLEDTVWDILDIRTLPNADLPRLKVLGRIVGQPRLNFSTESYRLLIEARALANVSRGRASDLLAVLELLVGPASYSLFEIGDATLWLTTLQPLDSEGVDLLTQILPDTRAAGVGLQLLFTRTTLADTFLWGDVWGPPEQWGTVRIL
jgi:hypothetical protein